jgi:putative endonuclease
VTQRRDQLGRRGEALAEAFLKRKGYTILEKNFTGKTGEIDIVASENNTIIFVEVKTRTSETFGSPKEAVDATKQKHIIKAATEYLQQNKVTDKHIRFDVVSILLKSGTLFERLKGPQIEHIESAFEVKVH